MSAETRVLSATWQAPRPSAVIPRHSLAQQAPGDDHPLDLARPLADRAELDVAVVLLGREVLDEAVAAEDLHALLRRPDGHFRRVELGHGRELRDALPFVLDRGGAVAEQTRGVDLRRHVGEHELDGLELRDGLAERRALLGVVAR